MKVDKMSEKPQLIFSRTQNGYWCEYLSGDWSITGVSGFSQKSPEEAEKNMWELLHKNRKAQLETAIMWAVKGVTA